MPERRGKYALFTDNELGELRALLTSVTPPSETLRLVREEVRAEITRRNGER